MAVFTCKNCGDQLHPAPGAETAICESCGSENTIPSITNERRADAYNRGNSFRQNYEFDKALAEYTDIIKEDPTDAEAHWCMALCRYGVNYQKDYTEAYIPTVDRLSENSFLEDPDYKAALKYAKGRAKMLYRAQGEHIEKIRTEMVRVAAQTEPYDVFICFKDTYENDPSRRTTDSVAAQEIYLFLQNLGYRVFFSRITLKEEHPGEEWEPYIYAALNTARVMLVVGTCREHMESPWVRNEWNRFRAVRRKDPTKALIACYSGMEPRNIPKELTALEALNIKDPDGSFYSTIQHAVERQFKSRKATVSAVQHESAQNYVIRAFQFIEDKNWDKADDMLEKAMNLDPENGEAHVGKLLIHYKRTDVKQLADEERPISESSLYSRAMRFSDPNRQTQLRAADAQIQQRIRDAEHQKIYDEAANAAYKASRPEAMEEAAALFESIEGFSDASARAEALREKADALRLQEMEDAYEDAISRLNAGKLNSDQALEVAAAFAELDDFRDAEEKYEEAYALYEKLLEQEEEAARESKYTDAVKQMSEPGLTSSKVKILSGIFASLGDYRQSAEWKQKADALVSSLLEKEKKAEEAARKQKERETKKAARAVKAKARRRRMFRWLILLLIIGFFVYRYYNKNVKPKQDVYAAAGAYMEVGDYRNACLSYFEAAESKFAKYLFKDAEEKGLEACRQWLGEEPVISSSEEMPWWRVNDEGGLSFDEGAYDGSNIVLPTIFNGQLVSGIADSGFSGSTTIQYVLLPKNYLWIGSSAFESCEALSFVSLQDVETIGESAFANCQNLTDVEVMGGLEILGANAFYACPYLNIVHLNEGLTEIGDSAFEGCTALTFIEIPSSVQYIGYEAFYGSGISYLSFAPEGNLVIGERAFCDLDQLTQVNTNGGVREIGVDAFRDCDYLTGVGIYGNCSVIGDGAFADCDYLTWLAIDEGVTTIGANAFESAWIEDLNLPTTLTSIGDYAFRDCDNLQQVIIPDGTSGLALGQGVFSGCEALTGAYLSGVTDIGDQVFDNCVNMNWVIVGDTLKTIGSWAFAHTKIGSIQLYEGLTTIGEGAFYDIDTIQTIEIPGTVSVIEKDTFADCEILSILFFHEGLSIIRDDAIRNTPALGEICYSGTEASWSYVSIGQNDPMNACTYYFEFVG